MNLKPAGIGAEPKKIAILAALLAVAAYFYFSSGSGSQTAASIRPGAAPLSDSRIPTREISRSSRASTRSGRSFRAVEEFRPSLKPSKYADIDRNTVDPTLHLDLLAKLKSVKADSGTRSIFDFGQGGPAPATAGIAVKEPAPILPKWRFIGPKLPPSKVEVAKGAVAPAPPIPLKFYGFVNQTKAGVKRAFFLDGDDIIVASEGQLIKSRYKIVRIGINSAVVEDTQFENHQQTLPLVEEITG